MSSLMKTSALVKEILENEPLARSDDNYLYLQVIERQAHERGIDLRILSVTAFLRISRIYGFSPFESVRRSRQKIQHDHPELAGDETTESYRMMKQEEYRDFARSVIDGR